MAFHRRSLDTHHFVIESLFHLVYKARMSQSNYDWLAAEPFTLTMSAGFFGFFAHTGFMQALQRAGLRPRRVIGVSAGAIVGGLWAGGVGVDTLEEELVSLRRADFWDPGVPLGGILKGRRFASKLAAVLAPTGVARIEHCHTPFVPVVFDLLRRKTVGLDRGNLADAIRASAALPALFRPVRMGPSFFVDGGFLDRPGLSMVPTDERVLLHHLPHSSPWSRWHGAEASDLPKIALRQILAIPELPRVTPFSLDQGPPAIVKAREATSRWLESPAQRDN